MKKILGALLLLGLVPGCGPEDRTIDPDLSQEQICDLFLGELRSKMESCGLHLPDGIAAELDTSCREETDADTIDRIDACRATLAPAACDNLPVCFP